MIYLYVGLGGIIGSVARFLCSIGQGSFPLHTLCINIAGSFLLGALTKYAAGRVSFPPELATAVGTGILGSFTTLSTFSLDTLNLLQSGKILQAFMYMAASSSLGLAAAYIGMKTGSKLAERGQNDG